MRRTPAATSSPTLQRETNATPSPATGAFLFPAVVAALALWAWRADGR